MDHSYLKHDVSDFDLNLDESRPSRCLSQNLLRPTFILIFCISAFVLLSISPSAPFPAIHPESSNASNSKEFDWSSLTPCDTLTWTPCYSSHKCARLNLPLDYLSASNATVQIALRLIPSTNTAKGTLLLNPGGPGGSGVDMMSSPTAASIQKIVGDYNILGFDPRGVGASTPAVRCFESEVQEEIWGLGREGKLGLEDGTVEKMVARAEVEARLCEEEGIGEYVGTTSVARDMLEISERMGDEKLNYWGLSYGSILGQYFAAMYPDRLGKFVIDGVASVQNYRQGIWYEMFTDTDAIIRSFYSYCHQAGPSKCPLYETTAAAIEARFWSIMHAVERSPVPVLHSSSGSPALLEYKHLLEFVSIALYFPLSIFPPLAAGLRGIETGNATGISSFLDIVQPPFSCDKSVVPFYKRYLLSPRAIACGDGPAMEWDRAEFNRQWERMLQQCETVTPVMADNYLSCSKWRMQAKWKYEGAFAVENTSFPMLVLSTMWDPVCPKENAEEVEKNFNGSVLLVQNSHGHCSFSSPSLCTVKALRAYFREGVLPEPGTVCEVEELPFVGAVGDRGAMSYEDKELLEAWMVISEGMAKLGKRVW